MGHVALLIEIPQGYDTSSRINDWTSPIKRCRKFDMGVTPGCQLKSAGRMKIASTHDMLSTQSHLQSSLFIERKKKKIFGS
jgi:hypothetical protein